MDFSVRFSNISFDFSFYSILYLHLQINLGTHIDNNDIIFVCRRTYVTYFQELWCLAAADGGECRETFDTYDDFEEHFCQKHLDLVLFACGARGCTAQFGTVLQIFRHLAICKRRGKKVIKTSTFIHLYFPLSYKMTEVTGYFFSIKCFF